MGESSLNANGHLREPSHTRRERGDREERKREERRERGEKEEGEEGKEEGRRRKKEREKQKPSQGFCFSLGASVNTQKRSLGHSESIGTIHAIK